MGASRYTPWVCSAAVWNGSGAELPRGYAKLFIATAVCCLRGRGACMGNFGNFWEFLRIFERGMGAPLYTPWVCGAAVWNGSGAELPRGYATVSFTAG